MKKIGIITLYKDNYGSILQCYSTKRYVEKHGFECSVISEVKRNKISEKLKNICLNLFYSIRYKGYFKAKINNRNAMRKDTLILNDETKEKMDSFVNSKFNVIELEWKQLENIKDYCAFIVGSDQVWNVSRKINSFYFLKFTEKRKRIAFGVSIGIDYIPKYNLKSFKDGINGFDKVSVREETAQKIIKDININKEIHRIGDPVLLLNHEEWKDIYSEVNLEMKDYILIHFLNEPNDIAIECIKWMSEKLNCNVIILSYNYEKFRDIKRSSYVSVSPLEYLYLIDNAVSIFSDSFHTTLFSIIFKKKFYTFNRQYLHHFPQTTRIRELLNRYNLNDKFVNNKEQFFEAYKNENYDYSLILEKERINTENYLKSELIRVSNS